MKTQTETPSQPAASPPAAARQPTRAQKSLNKLAPDVLLTLVEMANDPAGFETDRNPMRTNPENGLPFVPYTPDVLGRCALSALDQGFKVMGNEINIIGGELRVTLAGVLRKLRENKDLCRFENPPIHPCAPSERPVPETLGVKEFGSLGVKASGASTASTPQLLNSSTLNLSASPTDQPRADLSSAARSSSSAP